MKTTLNDSVAHVVACGVVWCSSRLPRIGAVGVDQPRFAARTHLQLWAIDLRNKMKAGPIKTRRRAGLHGENETRLLRLQGQQRAGNSAMRSCNAALSVDGKGTAFEHPGSLIWNLESGCEIETFETTMASRSMHSPGPDEKKTGKLRTN